MADLEPRMTKAQMIDFLVQRRQELGGSISAHNHRRILNERTEAELMQQVRRILENERQAARDAGVLGRAEVISGSQKPKPPCTVCGEVTESIGGAPIQAALEACRPILARLKHQNGDPEAARTRAAERR